MKLPIKNGSVYFIISDNSQKSENCTAIMIMLVHTKCVPTRIANAIQTAFWFCVFRPFIYLYIIQKSISGCNFMKIEKSQLVLSGNNFKPVSQNYIDSIQLDVEIEKKITDKIYQDRMATVTISN